MFRTVVDANETVKLLDVSARNSRAAARTLMRTLAIQLQRAARRKTSGTRAGQVPDAAGRLPGAGGRPIPARTGEFRDSFIIEVSDTRAAVANMAPHARSLHAGFRPYGNPHARPIPARPYFDEALDELDVDAALAAADKVLGEGA